MTIAFDALTKKTKAELESICYDMGLDADGKKAVLAERILDAADVEQEPQVFVEPAVTVRFQSCHLCQRTVAETELGIDTISGKPACNGCRR